MSCELVRQGHLQLHHQLRHGHYIILLYNYLEQKMHKSFGFMWLREELRDKLVPKQLSYTSIILPCLTPNISGQ